MPKHTRTQNEKWLPVVGHEGVYEISDAGRVKSLARVDARGRNRLKERFLSPSEGVGGYLRVNLRKGGRQTKKLVHRLVLEAFVGPCPPGKECRHMDGNPKNSRVENLKWGTKSENALDRTIHGTDPQARRTHCPRGHALVSPNLVAWAAKNGRRTCLACDRARSRVQKNPHLKPEFQQVSDKYLEQILKRQMELFG